MKYLRMRTRTQNNLHVRAERRCQWQRHPRYRRLSRISFGVTICFSALGAARGIRYNAPGSRFPPIFMTRRIAWSTAEIAVEVARCISCKEHFHAARHIRHFSRRTTPFFGTYALIMCAHRRRENCRRKTLEIPASCFPLSLLLSFSSFLIRNSYPCSLTQI